MIVDKRLLPCGRFVMETRTKHGSFEIASSQCFPLMIAKNTVHACSAINLIHKNDFAFKRDRGVRAKVTSSRFVIRPQGHKQNTMAKTISLAKQEKRYARVWKRYTPKRHHNVSTGSVVWWCSIVVRVLVCRVLGVHFAVFFFG